MQITIHLLTNPKFLGDKNQVLGILAKLEQIYIDHTIESKEWDDSNLDAVAALQEALNAHTSKKHPQIVLGSGSHSLATFKKMPLKSNPNILYVWSGHTTFSGLTQTPSLDFVALPLHAIDQAIRNAFSNSKTQLIETNGVPHNVSSAEIEELHNKWQESKTPIRASGPYIGGLVGGNVKREEGGQGPFTVESAKKLANYFAKLSKENPSHSLLITDSPRTPEDALETLLTELKAQNLPYEFFKFAPRNNAYKPILGAIQKSQSALDPESDETSSNIIVNTTDSTSMGSEISDTLPDIPLHLVNIDSAGDIHKAYATFMNKAGRAYVVEFNGTTPNVKPPAYVSKSAKSPTAAETIAATIQSKIEQES